MKMLIVIMGILFLLMSVVLFCCVRVGADADILIKKLFEQQMSKK